MLLVRCKVLIVISAFCLLYCVSESLCAGIHIKGYHGHEDVRLSRSKRDTKNPDVFRHITDVLSDTPDPNCSSNTYIGNITYDVIQRSPDYPQDIGNDRLCVWSFTAKQGRRLTIGFREFNISDNACDKGAQVKILEADHPESVAWSIYAKFCGHIRPFWVLTTSNALKIAYQDVPLTPRGNFLFEVASECGGKLYGPQGILEGEIDAQSPYNSSCEWEISARAGHIIQLTFDEFNIPDDDICSRFYLLIRDGKTDRSPYLGEGKYCGNEIPVLPPSSGRHVTVKLQRDWRDIPPVPVFRLQYTEVPKRSSSSSLTSQTLQDTSASPLICGNNLTVSEGSEVVISSPDYPRPSRVPAVCEWIITGPPTSRLRVDFLPDFEMTTECEHGDKAEYVQVLDGDDADARPLVTACGYRSPGTWYSSGNSLRIHFETEAHEPNSGFKAVIREAQTCGSTLVDDKGIISSPNFPEPYTNDIECEWFLHAKERETLNLTFLELDLPESADCLTTDHIEIRETGANGVLLGRFCGSLPNKSLSVQSIDNTVYVKFKSQDNTTYNGRGFQLYFYSRMFRCEHWLYEPEGEIMLPKIPSYFPHVRHCEWYIVAEKGKKVNLKIHEFNLKKLPLDGTCLDELSFTNATIRRQYLPDNLVCGESAPETIHSVGNTLALNLRISSHYAPRKFLATYTTDEDAECGGIYTDSAGIIKSPNYGVGNYSNDMQCIWTIKVDQGKGGRTLVLNVDELDIQGSPEFGCPRDFVWLKGNEIDESSTIYDIKYIRPDFGRLCGKTESLRITSPYPIMSVLFTTDYQYTFPGFKLSYEIKECGGIIDDPEGTIASPNYPNQYPENMDCHWILRATFGKQIELEFTKFDLEDDCDKDFVLLRNGESDKSPIIGQFCGKQIPEKLMSESNSLMIIFHSDGKGSEGGFEAKTKVVDSGCGGLFQSPAGTISSPEFPSSYPENIECSWILQMENRTGFHLRIRFADLFDVEKEESCSNDYLQFEENVDGKWLGIRKFCGNSTPALYSTFSPNLRITFHTNEAISGHGFRLSYQWNCGGIFTERGGVITSPDYPNLYETEMYCIYYILREPHEYITLDFVTNSFNLTGDPDVHCFDSVTVYAGNSTLVRKIGQYCGEKAPETLVSNGSMTIVFQSGSYYRRYGFIATYRVYDTPPTLASLTSS